MARREYRKRITRTLKYSEIFNDKGKFVGGGIHNSRPEVENEMWVEIMDDPVLDRESNKWGNTGRPQIHIGGTRKAFEELGVSLLALAFYEPPEPGYSISIELKNQENQPGVHLVMHLPIEDPNLRTPFQKIHNIATGFIDENGNISDTTLPLKSD